MKPIKRVGKNSQITENDIRNIWYHLEKNRNKIKRVQSIIVKIGKQGKVNSPLIFEFSFRNGKFVFNDID
ncbi:MAG: hypothetical protein IPM96_20300 [Ignavibacteria bacterium]|nr:hypothetical protein [Ignavibacteria bacterium]